jgi:hypothetical protein
LELDPRTRQHFFGAGGDIDDQVLQTLMDTTPAHFQKNSELNCRDCNVAFLDFVVLFRDKLLGQTVYGVALYCIEFQRQAATDFVHAALIPGVALAAKALELEIRVFDVEVFDGLLPSSHG